MVRHPCYMGLLMQTCLETFTKTCSSTKKKNASDNRKVRRAQRLSVLRPFFLVLLLLPLKLRQPPVKSKTVSDNGKAEDGRRGQNVWQGKL